MLAGVGIGGLGLDMRNGAAGAKAGNSKGDSPAYREMVGDVAERNKDLVMPYEQKMKEWAPLAFFGLRCGARSSTSTARSSRTCRCTSRRSPSSSGATGFPR